MPRYFPDLESVKRCAEVAASQPKPEKKYNGIIPKSADELPEARKQLGAYFRTVWEDSIQALEIELGVSEENYHEKLSEAIKKQFLSF